MSTSHQTEQSHHPTFQQYVLVAIILFVITIVEFFGVVAQTGVGLAVGMNILYIFDD